MNDTFRKGFVKAAAHVLAEMTYHNEDNELQAERQAILEKSYEGDDDRAVTKKRAVNDESIAPSRDPAHASYFN